MIETVIVPLDGSKHAQAAIPYAVEEATHYHAKLVLLRVVPRPECPQRPGVRGGPAPAQPAWSSTEAIAAETEAMAYLEDIRRQYGVDRRTELIVRVGDPFLRVRGEIQRHPHPLVVLTTGDPALTTPPYLSQMARRLLATATAPVLAVRQPGAIGAPRLEDLVVIAPRPQSSIHPSITCEAQ